MKNVNQFVSNVPFDKVIVFDREGNETILTTYKKASTSMMWRKMPM